jgi:hypothetical protein
MARLGALAFAFLALCAAPAARAAPVRLWEEVALAPLGADADTVRSRLKGAKLQKLRGGRKGMTALRERVSFERHTPALVTWRFIEGKLFEVELQYLKGGRHKKVAAFLKRKFGDGKRHGAVTVFRAGDRRVTFRRVAGRVRITFTSPGVLAEARAARERKKERVAERRRKKGRRKKKREEPPRRKAAPHRTVTGDVEDPALWKVLGVHTGPVRLFEVQLLREGRGIHLVAAGFARTAGVPLAAILSREGGGYRLHHIGIGCAGTPVDARAVDFRFDTRMDVAVYYRDGGRERIALLPFDRSSAGAKFIGGRYAGRNVFGCYELGPNVRALGFADVDHDRSLDLLLGYERPHAGPAHDVYFHQGTDFYFRETRTGMPRE